MILNKNQIQTVSNCFREALYNASSIPEALEIEVENLHRADLPRSIKIFTKSLMESAVLRRENSQHFIELTQDISDRVYDTLQKKYPEVFFELTSRRKSFVSEHHKRFSRYLKGQSTIIHDMVAIRIIILNNPKDFASQQNLVNSCYRIMDDCIDCVCSTEPNSASRFDIYTMSAESRSNVEEFSALLHPEIILPSEIPEIAYSFALKDYIANPKPNGYQSLHTIMEVSPTSTECKGMDFEMQLRTIKMHMHSEFGIADHEGYKSAKLAVESEDPDFDWKKFFEFDLNKVNIMGLSVDSFGNVHDSAGFMMPISLYSRYHTL